MRVLLLILLLTGGALARWQDTVLVIDPGHGDRGTAAVPADPGAHVDSHWECVFTWDTALRLKRAAQSRGAAAFLTLEDDQANYAPTAAPTFPGFRFKTLVDDPSPSSVADALYSRVATANRVYREHPDKDIYFISLHFDIAAPDLEGMSFYYPTWEGAGGRMVRVLTDEMRQAGRARTSDLTGAEAGVAQAHRYAVLSHSENPDSYLIELGNLKNPGDLYRARHAPTRQAYAELILRAIGRSHRRERVPALRPPLPLKRLAVGGAVLLVTLVLLTRRKRP